MDKIIKNFDCENKEHIMWLKSLHEGATNMSDGKSLRKAMETNPFGYKLENSMDIPEIHMILATKYTGAVLTKKAWIP